jgi:hypothetical protein
MTPPRLGDRYEMPKTRLVCDDCFALIAGFGSMRRLQLVTRCEVCGRLADETRHEVHYAAAEHAHQRLCAKLETTRCLVAIAKDLAPDGFTAEDFDRLIENDKAAQAENER